MKLKATSALAIAAIAGLGASAFGATLSSFTPGDLVVYRVGDGSATLTSASTAVFLDEYDTSGNLVGSLPMPTASGGASNPLTASGTATSEGLLTLSTNGQVLMLTGYDSAIGTASIAGTTAASVPREVGEVDGNANINTSTTLAGNFSGNNPRSAASVDGSSIYVSGANTGVVNTTLGSTGAGTVISSTVTNLRQLEIFGGQLYVSTGSGTAVRVATVGTGLPTTTGQTTTNLTGLPIGTATTPVDSPYNYFFATLNPGDTSPDTLYISDDFGGSTAGVGDIEKFSLVGGSWVANGEISAVFARGLTGSVSGSTVSLFASTGASLYSLTDTSGFDQTITGTLNTIASVGTNEQFRGIAFAPVAAPEPTTLGLLGGFALLGLRRRR